MSTLLETPLIISVAEFRKLTGKATDRFSDEQVTEFITQLDFMAEMFVKTRRKGQPSMKQG